MTGEPLQVARSFVDELHKMPLVEALHVILQEEVLDLWVIITKRDIQTELKIAKSFADLLRSCPDIKLDFLILPREGRHLKEILPRNGLLIWQREGKSTS